MEIMTVHVMAGCVAIYRVLNTFFNLDSEASIMLQKYL